MKINILSISKKNDSNYNLIYKDLQKMISRFAVVDIKDIFSKKIAIAQNLDKVSSAKAYTEAFIPYLNKNYSIALHPEGKFVDSYEFSKLIDGKMSLNFFIGGAYGFEESFLDRCDSVVSLGKITMSHKIAKVVLLEQIYRSFSILSGHPYHK